MKPRTVPLKGAMQAILPQRRTATPNDCIAYLIRTAAKSLVRALHSRLAEHNVSYGHWAFLRILWEGDGLTQRELSIEAGVMEPTTFSALKAMEQLGYVKRRQTRDNKKNVYVHLTPKGRALKAKLMPVALDLNDRIAVRGVRASDLAAARGVLRKIIENLAHDEISELEPTRTPGRQRRSAAL